MSDLYQHLGQAQMGLLGIEPASGGQEGQQAPNRPPVIYLNYFYPLQLQSIVKKKYEENVNQMTDVNAAVP